MIPVHSNADQYYLLEYISQILIWTELNALLVPSKMNKLKKSFDVCAFYVFVNVILSFENYNIGKMTSRVHNYATMLQWQQIIKCFMSTPIFLSAIRLLDKHNHSLF